jgi:hypothetical protein
MMTLRQSFGGLTVNTSAKTASGFTANPSGLSAQSGNIRIVPSASLNGFQSFWCLMALGMIDSVVLVDFKFFSVEKVILDDVLNNK